VTDQKDPVRVVDRRWWARGESAEGEDDASTRKPTYVEELERQIAAAGEKLQALMADHRRALDEFEQVKLRIRRDVARDVERGRRAILAEFLEVLDNLDRAVTAAEAAPRGEHAEFDSLTRGVAMVRDQFLARFDALGVRRVPALGQPFDAQQHEAVTTSPVQHPADEGKVIAVVREGYVVGDELLRPAAVVVGKYDAQTAGA
jgi:molecular chaperone GrpE